MTVAEPLAHAPRLGRERRARLLQRLALAALVVAAAILTIETLRAAQALAPRPTGLAAGGGAPLLDAVLRSFFRGVLQQRAAFAAGVGIALLFLATLLRRLGRAERAVGYFAGLLAVVIPLALSLAAAA